MKYSFTENDHKRGPQNWMILGIWGNSHNIHCPKNEILPHIKYQMRLPTTKNKILPNARSKPNTRSRRRFPSYTWGASASAAQGANQRPLTAQPTITTMVIVITKNIKLIISIL